MLKFAYAILLIMMAQSASYAGMLIWQDTPPFPASHLNSDTKRYQVGPYWIDCDLVTCPTAPLQSNIDAILNAPQIPAKVSVTQFAIALSRAPGGQLAAVQTWINSQDAETQLTWNRYTEIRRNSPLLARIAIARGWTPTQIDNFFIAASAINP